MQYKIFLIILLLTTFAFNISAQSVKNSSKILTQEEIDDRDVLIFFNQFVKKFEEVKDINQVPKSFFAQPFQVNFARNSDWRFPSMKSDLFDQLNEDEKYKNNVAFSNFLYLLAMYIFDKTGKSDFFGDLSKSLSPNLKSSFKKSKWLYHLIDDEVDEKEVVNKNDWELLITELQIISSKMRKYLNSRPVKNKIKYSHNFRKMVENFYSPQYSEICEGKDCMGLPEKTRIFALHAFSQCLRIAKINGKFKVVNIYLSFSED